MKRGYCLRLQVRALPEHMKVQIRSMEGMFPQVLGQLSCHIGLRGWQCLSRRDVVHGMSTVGV